MAIVPALSVRALMRIVTVLAPAIILRPVSRAAVLVRVVPVPVSLAVRWVRVPTRTMSVPELSAHARERTVTVPALASMLPQGRAAAVLVRVVPVRRLPAQALLPTLILMETAPETATNATAREHAGAIVPNVPELLLHAAVRVQESLITARLVLIPLAPAGMRPAAAIHAEIRHTPPEQTAVGYVSPATPREAA
jgi:hypothetical protein